MHTPCPFFYRGKVQVGTPDIVVKVVIFRASAVVILFLKVLQWIALAVTRTAGTCKD